MRLQEQAEQLRQAQADDAARLKAEAEVARLKAEVEVARLKAEAEAKAKAEAERKSGTVLPRDRLRDGSEGPALVFIKAGCFQMGSLESEAGREGDERQHQVCIERDYALGKEEVTVGEFQQFITASGYKTDAEKNAGGAEGCYVVYQEGSEWKYGYRVGYSWKNPGFSQTDDHPVVCVSWNDAVAYTRWLSGQTGQSYRLPTEAEWEYAARAGTTTARYWGNDPNQACQYANVADQTAKQTFPGWSIHDCQDGYIYVAPVGSFKANAWGLRDMLGNVREWTCSEYDGNYGGAEKECNENNTNGPRALRGGSWNVTVQIP